MSQVTRVRPDTGGASRGAGARLSFLDALRGVAALSVALGHRAESTFAAYPHFDQEYFRLGQFGVVAFFVTSGFIIPASLERGGSLARFWKGRFFRLYPLYWLVLAAVLGLAAAGVYELGAGYPSSWLLNTAANATMAQALGDLPLALGLSWTLGYELGFYVLMSLLFTLGLHRHSRSLAGVWALLALGFGLLNLGLPAVALPLLAVVALGSGGLAWRHARSGRRLIAGGVLAVVVAGLMFNRHGEAWFNVSLLAAMFAGTVLYRHFSGLVSARSALAAYAGAAVLVCVTVGLNAEHRSWVVSFAAAFGLFGLLYAVRGLRFPRFLVFLGTISYSVYLVHPVVFALVPPIGSHPLLGFALAIAATVALATLSHEWVEKPMIALGRKKFGERRTAGTRPIHPTPDNPHMG